MIEDIHTLVKGGVVESGTGVAAIRNPDTYRRWGASLKYNPTLIEYEVRSRKNLNTELFVVYKLTFPAGDIADYANL